MAERIRNLRHELKYYIDEGEYLTLRERLMYCCALDANASPDTRQYHIRSLYFDDIDNSALWEKQFGVRDRHKYRIRIYNLSDGVINLERKTKVGQYIAKESVKLTRGQCDALLAGDFSFLIPSRYPLLEEMYAQMRTRLLRPVVIVDYFRETYVYPAGNVRITFDRELHSGNFSRDLFTPHPASTPILPPGQLILEIKYNAVLPPHVRAMLQLDRSLRSAISKYTLCRRHQ